jgi:DNA polymerase I-like protein with 3'-5' exonuclease and polymerase domains
MPQPTADDDLSEFLAMAMGEDKPVPPEPKAKAPEPKLVGTAEPDVPVPPSAAEEFLEATVESATTTTKLSEPKGDDPSDFFANNGIQPRRTVPNDEKPWMKHHVFTQVKTVEAVNRIVDECIKRGFCALDLETQGLDNRIVWTNGKPDTVHQIVGYCISYDGIEGFYIPIRHRPTDDGPDLNVKPLADVNAAITRLCRTAIPVGTPEAIEKDLLSYESERPPVVIGFWNAQFDQEFLFPVTGIDWWHPNSFEDGMLACFTKYAGDKGIGLKIKAKQLLRDPDGNPYEMVELKELFDKGRKIQFDTLAPDEPGVLRYAGSDAICTYKLCQLKDLVALCRERHTFTYRLEKQTTEALRPMERNRVRITRDKVKATLVEQEKVRDALLEKIRSFARDQGAPNLDANSPKQLSEFLFGSRPKGLDISPKPDKNEASGQYKTDGETLEELAKVPNAPAILKDIVRYRESEKFIGTYLVGLANNPDANSELRFSFKQTGAASGRFSAPAGDHEHGYSGVPVHGIPADSEVRRNFVAREGYTMVKADYAGEELRIAANVSGERVWIDEFLNGSGDLHSITARAFFNKQEVTKEERNSGKIANFSLLYGGGPAAIVRATGCDRMEAARRKQAFDKAVPIFAKWIKGQHAFVKKEMGVRTAFGRWLPIPDANHPDGAIRSACERHSVNYVIQGAAADIMKIVLVLLHKALHRRGWLKNGGDDSVRMLLTVHDEVVFEVRHDRVAEVLPIIVEIMESPWKMPKAPEWRVPLVVEPLVGFNWGSGYKVERASKDYKPAKDEVLMNGFVYSTTRKPKTKNDKIVESLDIQEELVEGKKLFRVVDPPWLMGRTPGEPGDEPSSSEPTPPSSGETPAVTLAPETVLPEATAEVPQVEIQPVPVPLEVPLETTPAKHAGSLRLGINQLNEQTVEQVCSFVIDSIDNDDGEVLHLTDIVGETLIAPDRVPPIKVTKDKLIGHLRRHNLLCLPD